MICIVNFLSFVFGLIFLQPIIQFCARKSRIILSSFIKMCTLSSKNYPTFSLSLSFSERKFWWIIEPLPRSLYIAQRLITREATWISPRKSTLFQGVLATPWMRKSWNLEWLPREFVLIESVGRKSSRRMDGGGGEEGGWLVFVVRVFDDNFARDATWFPRLRIQRQRNGRLFPRCRCHRNPEIGGSEPSEGMGGGSLATPGLSFCLLILDR